MSILFRTADPISPASSQSGWYEAFAPPETADFAQPIVEESAPEVISPLDRAISRAEEPAPVRQAPPAARAGSSPPAESLAIRAPDSVQEPIAPVLPEPEAAPPPGIQQEVADTSPPAESGPSKVESSDQDWGGAWGRLKTIMRRHEAQQESSEASEMMAEPEPSKPKPASPKRLADAQRQTSTPSRMPPPGERRRVNIEYIKPGQPPSVPDQPGESESDIREGTTVQRGAEEAASATQEPIVVESSEQKLPEGPALSERPEKTVEERPADASTVETPEPTSEPDIPRATVQRQVETTLEESPTKDDAHPMTSVEPEASLWASPDHEEASPESPAIQEATEAAVEAEQTPPTQQPQQIQRKEAEGSPAPGASVTEHDEPEALTGDAQEEGLGQRLLGAARRLLGGERPPEPKVVRRKEEHGAEKASQADLSSSEQGPLAEEAPPIKPDLSDMPVGPARVIDEPPRGAVVDAYIPADAEPAVPGEVRDVTIVPRAPSPASTTPEQEETAASAEIVKTSEETSPPEFDAMPVKPPEASVPRIQRDTSSGPTLTAAKETGASPVEKAPEEPADASGSSVTPSVESESDDVETLIQAVPESPPSQPMQALPLDQVWPVKQVAGEPPQEIPPESQPGEQVEAPRETVLQRRTSGGDESADQVDQALRKVTPGQKSDSAVELVTPRWPRPEQPADDEPPIAPPPEAHSRDEMLSEAESTPGPVASQLLPVEPSGAAPEGVQRQIDESLVTPASAGTPAERPSQEEPREVVPTEIGDLPLDFWALMGQEPPKPRPATPPAAIQRTPESTIQPSPSGEAKAQTAVAKAPVAQQSSLDQFISREWQVPLIQRADADQDVSTSMSERSVAEETRQKQPSAEEIEKLAQVVYAQIKRRLAIERERTRGRY